jgi:uncharacterized protein YecE (DUF72 family)
MASLYRSPFLHLRRHETVPRSFKDIFPPLQVHASTELVHLCAPEATVISDQTDNYRESAACQGAAIRIGTAGWQAPKEVIESGREGASHLERYSTVFNAVEINTSFYRPHRRATYARWAHSTPDDFRFCVKVPKQITHEARLVHCGELIEQFVEATEGLETKLEVLLVQLPPTLPFDEIRAVWFVSQIRCRLTAMVVFEPRHKTWFTEQADAFFRSSGIGRVAADPAMLPIAKAPGGVNGFAYYRWHGSPRIYYSGYDLAKLGALAIDLQTKAASGVRTWCIFDNTAAGAATRNALTMTELVRR